MLLRKQAAKILIARDNFINSGIRDPKFIDAYIKEQNDNIAFLKSLIELDASNRDVVVIFDTDKIDKDVLLPKEDQIKIDQVVNDNNVIIGTHIDPNQEEKFEDTLTIPKKVSDEDREELRSIIAEEITSWDYDLTKSGARYLLSLVDVFDSAPINDIEDIIYKISLKASADDDKKIMPITVVSMIGRTIKVANFEKSKYLPVLGKMDRNEITARFLIGQFYDICRGAVEG